jgi:hypothetical protein
VPRILFVAMPESVHAARWISQIADQGWDIYLFPVHRARPHPDLFNLTLFGSDPIRPPALDKGVRYKRWSSYYFYSDTFYFLPICHINNIPL